MEKRWKVSELIGPDLRKQFAGMQPIITQLLWNRGIRSIEESEKFLHPNYETQNIDPLLFRGMRKAVDRILLAREKKEKVVIYGDYDADGVCASALLFEALKRVGINPHVHLPHREKEGYGLNSDAAKEFISKGFSLILTCDCGISSFEEIAMLQRAQCDVIITDHHVEPPKLPNAFCILDPVLKKETYPNKHLVGTGVAFKLIQALYQEARARNIAEIPVGEEKWFLDLVAIATIADFGPLVGENRTITFFGLHVLSKTKRPGLQSLLMLTRAKTRRLDATAVAFQIVPRLNAASRMEHANSAFELLVEKDLHSALILASKLDTLNSERQKKSDNMFTLCKVQIGDRPKDEILIAVGEGWSAGLVGLVAGKLLQVYQKPVLVIGKQENEIVGSGRSSSLFDITAALGREKQNLQKFGGHPQACGFTVKKDKLELFIKGMKHQAKQYSKKGKPELTIDAELSLDEISWDIWENLQKFEPFGEGNSRPLFLCKGVVVEAIKTVGAAGKHLQVMVRHNSTLTKKIIAFGFAEAWKDQLPQGQAIDIVYELSVNEWNGNRELEIKLVDIKKKKEKK